MFIAQVLTSQIFLASYYPGCGQTMHPLATFPTVSPTIAQGLDLENDDNSGVKSGGEWFSGGGLPGLAEGPSHISEALANKVF
jgi:hypothetical protein